MHAIQHQRRILTAPHPDEALNCFFLGSNPHRAAPRRVRLHDRCDVSHGNGCAVLALEHNALDVLGGIQKADAAHGYLFVAVAQKTRAYIDIGLAESQFNVA